MNFKIQYPLHTAVEDGIACFYSDNNYGCKVTALDKNMEPYNNSKQVDHCHNKTASYAMKKGNTYYFLLTRNREVWFSNIISIRFCFTSYSDNVGKTLQKAKKFKNNVSGVAELNSSNGDWYKLSLSKKEKKRLTIQGIFYGEVNVELYNSKGKKIKTLSITDNETSKQLTLTPKKGTYYFKVVGVNDGSGRYTLNLQ